MPDISVVIPTHDGGDLLLTQLDALAVAVDHAAARGTIAEIIVVDNRSSDGTVLRVRNWSTERDRAIRVVEASAKTGEPYARNVGIDAALADRIAFCDCDDQVADTWLSAMSDGLQRHDYVTGPVEMEALNEPWQNATRPGLRSDAPGTTFTDVPFAHGCNIGLTREAIVRLGRFDESWSIGCDVELGVRAWRNKVTLGWAPDALVHYRLRPTLRDCYRQGRNYGRVLPRLRGLLCGNADLAEERRRNVRRVGWLIRHLPVRGGRPARAGWLMTLARLDGELRGSLARGGG